MGGGRKLQEAGLGKGRDWQKQRESRVADGTVRADLEVCVALGHDLHTVGAY